MISRHILLVCFFAIAGLLPFASGATVDLHSDYYEKTVTILQQDGTRTEFNVMLATKASQQAQGLMYVTDLPQDQGMLFLFRTAQERKFWMKNTFIPLDIIFIATDGRIQHIHSMAKPQSLDHITSGEPSLGVLEINGGLADKMNLQPGDYVIHSGFDNLDRLNFHQGQ